VRDSKEQAALWTELLRGAINIVASDHSPAPPDMKSGDFSRAWGGISGVQSTFSVLLEQGHYQRSLPLERIASLLAAAPAERFRIANKGSLVPGNDADLALVDLPRSFTLTAEDLLQRHRLSPYIGSTFRGVLRRTIRRGETIFSDGVITALSFGDLIRPANAQTNPA
jgi:allantoinase